MIDTDLLKEKILDLAMRGKLVEQDPADGNTRDLLQEIQAEREQLIKEKKIKKTKTLPPISEDEIPYEIPESWEWVRLGDILLEHLGGGTPSKKVSQYWGGNIPWCSIKDFHGDTLTETIDSITEEGLNNSSSNLIQSGNLIVATRLAVGKIMLTNIDVAINQDLRALFFGSGINKIFIRYIYGQLNFVTQGVTVKGININNLMSIVLPLPPTKEQERIVKQLNGIYELIEQLSKSEENYKLYTELISKKTLDLAMQGKLVPQLPEEGTASTLLEEVAAERQRLVDEKKIKKTKPLPEISEEEIPYEIPESWEWVRLGELIELISGKDFKSDRYNSVTGDGIPYLTGASNIIGNQLMIDRWTSTPENIAIQNDILISVKGTVGKLHILTENQVHIARQFMAIRLLSCKLNINYVYYYLENSIKSLATAAKGLIPGISRVDLLERLIPIPPEKEQERIVNKLNEIEHIISSNLSANN
ncbi:hypothetical protein CL176_09565 [Suicoccus acidiformans]|uniref:Type I restriction modification DNA specificity domain-containing protein n=1 Tax=Suicoccus acidiformans TaxID=2036206 RepID=A0A347WMB9_9LACT|nr:restriction endonuclease subunit S [Suicoccus acidiformans]AXY26226.1 hypothetical protein CL176_09565 [Suicoccus acidiformans]